jgi:hypothetical protein
MTEDSLNNPSNAQIVDRAPTRKFSFLEAPRSIVEIDPKSFDEAAGITYSREPHWLLDFKALCATIQWEHPQSSPRGILTEIRNNAQVIRKWRRYAGFLQKLSAPRLGLETDVGRMSFEATREPDGVMSVSISLSPRAIASNPFLLDPVFDPWNGKYLSLDREGVEELTPFIRERYRGDEITLVSEGCELNQAIAVRVYFREGGAANLASVAISLAHACISREFDRLFLRLIRRVAARRHELDSL